MTAVFDNYARYYDLLYRDKDYAGEAAYVAGLIKEQLPHAATILELGCGTGTHAVLLARLGFQVHGVDMSEAMVAQANARKAALEPELAARLSFGLGDARSVRTGASYDAVISLFHVVSYQSTNADLAANFATARTHLRAGGLFLFDTWYGPAVLRDPPVTRIKRLEDEAISVVRLAEPVMHYNENLVDVHYEVQMQDKATGAREQLTEVHRMRYLFAPELEMAANAAQMHTAFKYAWMTRAQPGEHSWGAVFGMLAD